MSTEVDQRVVQMQFDNKQFESATATTMSTLEKLKEKLNLKGATKGLEDVDAAAKKLDFSHISNAVETVKGKFTALEVMAVTALANITNSAVNAGKKIVSALTIDPIKAGFSEYETQINSVQTIMSNTRSKGTTLDDVNSALDELNTYADKTIYNFTEMTRNIGTFTAAGVDLDTSVSAIKGIANLAAVSGSTSQQASTAMYQLSQALASGTVKLMDWNSVVNAGMGGQVFQDALKETAKVHGKNVDAMIKKEGSFRETLKNGWLTSEILTETLAKFTGDLDEATLKKQGYTDQQIKDIIALGKDANDAATKVKTLTQLWDTLKEAAQSGWSQSWEIIVGDFEEAKKLFTEVSDTIGGLIGASAESRNKMLQGWKDLGGRTAVIDAIRNAFEGVMLVVKPVSDAFKEIFPPITAKQLADFSKGLQALSEKLIIGEETADKIKRTFKGLFAILDIVRQVIVAVFNAIVPLFGEVSGLGGGILDLTASWGDWLVNLNETIKKGDFFNKVFGKVSKVLQFVVSKIKQFVSFVGEKIASPGFEALTGVMEKIHKRITSIIDGFKSAKKGVTDAVDSMGNSLVGSQFLETLQTIWEVMKKLGSGLIDVFGKAFKNLGEAIASTDFKSILDLFNSASLGAIAVGITKFVKGAKEAKESGGILDQIKDILGGVKDTLEAYQEQLKAGTLLKIATAIGILAASILVISLIDSDKLAASLAAMAAMFGELMGSMFLFNKIGGDYKNTAKAVTAMIGMSVAVLILASALKKISSLSVGELIKGLYGVSAMLLILVGIAELMSKQQNDLKKGAGQMVVMAIALNILVKAMQKIGAMSVGELIKSIIGIAYVLTIMVGVMAVMDKFDHKPKGASQMIALATSLIIVAGAMKIIATMSWEEWSKALLGVGAALGLMAGTMAIMDRCKSKPEGAAQMIGLATSLIIVAGAMKIIATMSWEEWGRAILGIVIALGSMVGVTAIMDKFKHNPQGAAQIVALSASLLIVAGAMKIIATMSWEEWIKALSGMLISLGLMVAALAIMSKIGGNTMASAAAILVMSVSLIAMATALRLLGSMSLAEIGKALLGLAGAFVIIGAAAYVLAATGGIVAVLALAGAIALIGVATLAMGAGLTLAAVGITMLATSLSAGATAIVAAIGVILMGIVALLPQLILELGKAINALCIVIIQSAPMICQAVTVILLSIVQALVAIVPVVVDAVLLLITKLLESLAEYLPRIVQAGFDIIIAFLQGIADNISEVVQAAIDIVLQFIDGIAQKIPDVIQAGYDLIISFIDGLADAIENNTDRLIKSMNNLIDVVIKAAIKILTNSVTTWTKKGGELMSALRDGISDKIEEVKESASELVTETKAKIEEKISEFTSAGKNVIDGFIEGIREKISEVGSAASEIGSKALNSIKDFLGIESPAKELIEVGKYSDMGMAVGLKRYAGKVVTAAKGVGKSALNSMKNSISNISDIINSDVDSQPTIRPVLDLSDVASGAGQIGRMFSLQPSVGVLANVGAVNSMMGRKRGSSNDDVISAIKDLKKAISASPGNSYVINGVTYDDGSNVSQTVEALIRAIKMERRT